MMGATFPAVGEHGLLDLYGIDAELACDEGLIRQYLLEAARLAGATVLQSNFHHFGQNLGITGVLLLSESHISIHTWPEHQFAAIDIFMCGAHQIHCAVDYLKQAFGPQNFVFNLHQRGKPPVA
ncbi:S-adenosylmethionine decarboxylase proenzyme [Saezia sanguinis]|uniref:S-adenosylmethionine decarboxylase proenzyme n=1 Tax=Saezia sanguinis TaxID=1965230 RepID=A0A433SC43_9BURK|nr:adenosylmethionine decarboxylase [Saezia sanguinis]RUS66289.1 S-adenosylmethionine decarboxylase proenzyme [Saezia sanguinis]